MVMTKQQPSFYGWVLGKNLTPAQADELEHHVDIFNDVLSVLADIMDQRIEQQPLDKLLLDMMEQVGKLAGNIRETDYALDDPTIETKERVEILVNSLRTNRETLLRLLVFAFASCHHVDAVLADTNVQF